MGHITFVMNHLQVLNRPTMKLCNNEYLEEHMRVRFNSKVICEYDSSLNCLYHPALQQVWLLSCLYSNIYILNNYNIL